MENGWIFNIQKYSIHDGPGIRTTVFMKGCPLRCWWCHNPESQSPRQEVSLTEGRCIRCGSCLDVCPEMDRETAPALPFIDRERCTRCGACVDACVTGTREMLGREASVGEVMIEILQDRIFYDQSGGGVTLSGGEPLMQPEFTRSLLEACQKEGVRTAVDTCGFAPQQDILRLAALTDLFLYDIKVMDEQKHIQHAGVSNSVILENLVALNRQHENIWMRIPVVPGLNNDSESMLQIARFAETLEHVQQVNLLPYHELGAHKVDRLGHRASVERASACPEEPIESFSEPFQRRGIRVLIGG